MDMTDTPMETPQLQEPHFDALADINDIPIEDLPSERIPDKDPAVRNEVNPEEVETMNEELDTL